MTPTAVRGITIQLREFSWYYGTKYMTGTGTFYVIENTELTPGTLYLTSDVWYPGIESSRFDTVSTYWFLSSQVALPCLDSPHKMKYRLIIIVVAVVAPVYRRLFGWFIVSAQTQPLVQASYPSYKTKWLHLVRKRANEPVDVIKMGWYFIAAALIQHLQPLVQDNFFIQDLIFLVQDRLALWDARCSSVIANIATESS